MARSTGPEEARDRQRGGPPQRVWTLHRRAPQWEDAAACMVGQSTNRHSAITTDSKRPLSCGVTRAVRLPWRT
jgi:hypothetical protein